MTRSAARPKNSCVPASIGWTGVKLIVLFYACEIVLAQRALIGDAFRALCRGGVASTLEKSHV